MKAQSVSKAQKSERREEMVEAQKEKSSPFATVPLSRFRSSDRIEQLPGIPGIL